MEFWELTENGGSQWKVEEMPGDCGSDSGLDGVTKYFATSFELCLKRQVIDLLAEDYSSEQLDAQPPVTMTVTLLDENQEVIEEFKPDPVSHTFSEYGPGLRFITFEHGGQDAKFWDGWFGVRVTGSSVTVEV
ncbi:hypothetical protein F7725_016482 [Dissostichus mawsoni]|uniref:FBA domain-containing protein n=1 Tax=Dissostichus mawsoni TaxID=36200 RepID=A0A7J5Z3V5_DISMA|nr:hypothetical protein F7725_016482 [Dissostichus mawsoni]